MDPFDDDWDFLMDYFTRDGYAVATEHHLKPAPGHVGKVLHIGMVMVGLSGASHIPPLLFDTLPTFAYHLRNVMAVLNTRLHLSVQLLR